MLSLASLFILFGCSNQTSDSTDGPSSSSTDSPSSTTIENLDPSTLSENGKYFTVEGTTDGIRITLKDGEVLEAEGRICFYQRSCRLGDYVFNDGTYSDELIGNKIPVGICFYIDPRNPENRLMVAMRNITTATNAWGLMSNWIGDSDFGGLDNVVLEGDPEYDCYNIE